ncbi:MULTISPECIES: PLP-dependent aminotransferase family protein [Acinetobacter]|uniref:GntR family transcriptional regulator n=2 Tax=Acinetobacter calcoaceticus/baumannii complex TaxID=909768 RepID=A0A4Y3JD24_ACIPI|nr:MULTISPECIES: PLP-dependent aminotransferase family protein [Acinetobacter]GEA69829.1 GntR family transcriptional regulator [Acinetobacter pittii]
MKSVDGLKYPVFKTYMVQMNMQQPWKIKLHLGEREEKTIFLKLGNQIIQEILSGRLKQGTRLQGSRSLANELGINRKTVQSVYEDLEAQGWLISKPRQGTFVSEHLPDVKTHIEPNSTISTFSQATTDSYTSQIQIINDGLPDTRLIPYELFSRAYRHALIKVTRQQIMGYGDPQGSLELRQALLNMLLMERFIQTSLDHICVVRGSQMGIFLAARVLAKQQQRQVIVVEQWSYAPAVETFLSTHFQIIQVRLDQHGLSTDHLIEILENHKVAAVYTTPHHQYPTTVSMAMDRRLKLLELSKTHNFYIIEDDYDHEFHYDSRPIPPLVSLPHADQVIHIGSLSKVFAPSLRVGYVVADLNIINAMKQDILLIDKQGNAITELAIAELMQQGEIKRHTRKMKKIYHSRRDFAVRTFHQIFQDKVEIQTPAGGMALWVKLKLPYRLEFAEILKQLQIDSEYELGSIFQDSSDSFHIRFGFAAQSEEEMTLTIQMLFQAFFD